MLQIYNITPVSLLISDLSVITYHNPTPYPQRIAPARPTRPPTPPIPSNLNVNLPFPL